MSRKFVRNITNTRLKGEDKEPLETNVQNDLLSDDQDVYVRNQDEYHCITNDIKEIVVPIESGNDTILVEKTDKNTAKLTGKIIDVKSKNEGIKVEKVTTNNDKDDRKDTFNLELLETEIESESGNIVIEKVGFNKFKIISEGGGDGGEQAPVTIKSSDPNLLDVKVDGVNTFTLIPKKQEFQRTEIESTNETLLSVEKDGNKYLLKPNFESKEIEIQSTDPEKLEVTKEDDIYKLTPKFKEKDINILSSNEEQLKVVRDGDTFNLTPNFEQKEIIPTVINSSNEELLKVKKNSENNYTLIPTEIKNESIEIVSENENTLKVTKNGNVFSLLVKGNDYALSSPYISDCNNAQTGFYSFDINTKNTPEQLPGQLISSLKTSHEISQIAVVRKTGQKGNLYFRNKTDDEWTEWVNLNGGNSNLDEIYQYLYGFGITEKPQSLIKDYNELKKTGFYYGSNETLNSPIDKERSVIISNFPNVAEGLQIGASITNEDDRDRLFYRTANPISKPTEFTGKWREINTEIIRKFGGEENNGSGLLIKSDDILNFYSKKVTIDSSKVNKYYIKLDLNISKLNARELSYEIIFDNKLTDKDINIDLNTTLTLGFNIYTKGETEIARKNVTSVYKINFLGNNIFISKEEYNKK